MASSLSLLASTETYDPITLPATWTYLLTPLASSFIAQAGAQAISVAATGDGMFDDPSTGINTINYPGGSITTGAVSNWGSTLSGADFSFPVQAGLTYTVYLYATAYEARLNFTAKLADASAANVSSPVDASRGSGNYSGGYMGCLISFRFTPQADTTFTLSMRQDAVYTPSGGPEGNAHFMGLWVTRTGDATTYTGTASDSAAAGHSQTAKVTLRGTASQSAAATDPASGKRTGAGTASDAAGSSDAVTSAAAQSGSSPDVAAATDTGSSALAYAASCSIAASAAEVVALATSLAATAAELSVVAGLAGAGAAYAVSGVELHGLADTLGLAQSFGAEAFDAVPALDLASAGSAYAVLAAAGFGLAETIRLQVPSTTISPEWRIVIKPQDIRFGVAPQALVFVVERPDLTFAVEPQNLRFAVEPNDLTF